MTDKVFLTTARPPASPSDSCGDQHRVAGQLAEAMKKHGVGDLDGAVQIYRAILADYPDNVDALHLLGVAAQQKGNPSLALKLIETALAHNANYAAAWANRALVLHVLGQTDQALRSAQLAIENDPNLGRAWDMAATLLRQIKNYDEAVRHHQQALKVEPSNLSFRANFAATYMALNDIQAAYTLLRSVVEPDENGHATGEMPPVLGNILQAAGYPLRALRCYRRAAEQSPHMPDAYVNEALAHLKIGDYETGLRLWQTRRDSKDAFFKEIPKWDGKPVDHLLLYEDQGMGDAIQCLRYLPQLMSCAAHITLQIIAPLRAIIAANFPAIDVITLDDPVPPANARLSLMSLPLFFKTALEKIPAAIPYLYANPDLRGMWRSRFSALATPKIGLVWGGNPDYPNDKNRSVPFAHMQPVIDLAQPHLVSLQLGRPKDHDDVAASGIMNAAPDLKDFNDTAAALMELDLLITVDTAIAHLAGALGRPVWLMIPFDPDWRWMLEREDSPWYPTVKLYRQTKPGDWSTVLPKLSGDIGRFLQGDRSVLRPTIWQSAIAVQNSHALDLRPSAP